MNKRVAFLISVIGHPVLVNACSLWLFMTLYPQLNVLLHPKLRWIYMGFIFLSTGILPVLFVLITRLFSKKVSLMLDDKEDRNFPYIFTASLYLFNFYLAKSVGSPPLLVAYLLACSSIVVAVLIINIFTKISIHATSLGAMAAVIFCATWVAGFDIRYLFGISLVVSGLIISSRLFMEAHKPGQVFSGFILGFMLMWFIL